MDHEGNEQGDQRRVSQVGVSFADYGHKSELGDGEGQEGEDQGEHRVPGQMSGFLFLRGGDPALHCVDTAGDDAGDHVYRRGDGSQDDQKGDNGGQHRGAHALLHQHQHRYGGCSKFRHVGDSQQAHNGQFHGEEIADKHTHRRFVDLFGICDRLHMLIHNGDGSQLEEEVQDRGPESRAESAGFFGEHGHLPTCHASHGGHDGIPLGDDVGHQYYHQADDNQNA